MNKLFIDQYGTHFYATSITALKREQGIPGKISRIYVDSKDGKTYHTGWCIGRHWFSVFTPMREAV